MPATANPGSIPELPFRTTQSEQRIIRELLQTGNLRHDGFAARVCAPQHLAAQEIGTAGVFIEWLRHELYPQEMQLHMRRTEQLEPLNGGPARAHFDQTLETPTITLQARIRNAQEYRDLVRRLSHFDFGAWVDHCNRERADAD